MPASILEPYREEIFSMLRKGQNKTDVWHSIMRKHGVKISRSQFYDFAKQPSKDSTHGHEEERIMPLREVKVSEMVTADEIVQAFIDGLPRAIEEFSGRLTALEQQSREHDQKTLSGLRHFNETLAGVTKGLEALPARVEVSGLSDVATVHELTPTQDKLVAPETLRSIWKRAFIVSGVFWGVIELLLIRGYWHPLWRCCENGCNSGR
jgi:hypothetical protein